MLSSPRDLKGTALAIGYSLLLYWPAVSGLGYFFERDIWLYWVPHIEWVTRSLALGHLPQWNPFKGFGSPFLADPNFQFFYPPSILHWVLPVTTAYTVLVTGHTIFGALGAYRLLKGRLRSRISALVGAALFVGAGPIVSSANLWHHFCAVMFMPWILDAFLRLRAGRGSIRLLGLLTGLQALSGSADVCVMTGAGLVFLLPRSFRRLRRLMPRLGAAVVLCFGLAAVQWIPTAMLAAEASRASLPPETRLQWSVSPETLIDFFVPLSGAAHATPGSPDFAEQRARLIPWMYLGASTLPLLVLGVRRSPRAALMLLLALVLTLGRHTPMGGWVAALPVISSLRFPSKLLWLLTFCWAGLAAIGHKELGRPGRVKTRYLAPVGGVMVCVALGLLAFTPVSATDHADWGNMWRFVPWAPLGLGCSLIAMAFGGRGSAAVALVVAIDLLVPGQAYNAYASGDMFLLRPSLVDELHRHKAARIHVFQNSRPPGLSWKVPDGWSEKQAYYFAESQFLVPPQSLRWSIKGSFDGDFTGLAPREYSTLTGIAGSGETLKPGLLRLAGVTHALRFRGPEPLELPLVASVATFHERPVLLLGVPDPLPMAYVVHRVRTEPSADSAIKTLADPAFDGAREVIRVQAGAPSESLAGEGGPPSTAARIEAEEDGRWRVRSRLSEPGTLVVLMAFSKGWRATVDGKPAPIRPANVLFQSVDLGIGEHVIELEYETPGLRLGLGLSSIAWASLALLSFDLFRKRT